MSAIASGYRPGTVVTYTPDPSRYDPRWCREGIALADDRGHLVDTYWNSGQDAHLVTEAEAPSVAILFHLEDYDELGRGDAGNRATWETYATADRAAISQQHGHQHRYFIRKDAEPDLDTQIDNARVAFASAEYDVQAAQRHLEWRQEELDRLVDVGTEARA